MEIHKCPECGTDAYAKARNDGWWCRKCKSTWPYEGLVREAYQEPHYAMYNKEDD